MNGRFFVHAGLCAVMVTVASSTGAYGQAGNVNVTVKTSDCNYAPVGNVTVQLNGRSIQSSALGDAYPGNIPPGTYQVRAAVPTTPAAKLTRMDYYPSGVPGVQTSYADASGTATFNTGPNGGMLSVHVCAAKAGKVRIATTQSCTDAPAGGFSVQPGVTVNIGGKTYTSNANGVIEVELPPGSYPVTASWKDYALGYVAQNGLRQKRNEAGDFTVRVTDSDETLEVRMLTCDPDGQAKARAVVTEIGVSAAGPATIRIVRNGKGRQVFAGMQLRDGDSVTIRGTAKLKWLQGGGTISFDDPKRSSIINIGPDNTPAGNKAPESQSVFQVLQGVADFILPANNPDEGKFQPSSHTIVCGPKGTHFSLGYDPATQTSAVVVRQGSVLVTPRNPAFKPFTLQAGQRVDVAVNHVGPITGASGAVSQQNPPLVPAPAQSIAGGAGTRSAHGCVGFDGGWKGPNGTMVLRNGAGPYGQTTVQGTVSGNTLRGTYQHPTAGRGTFVFTLSPDGDSFGTVFTSSAGVRGDYTIMRCVGP